MATRYDTIANSDWIMEGSPSGFRSSNLRPIECDADLDPLTSQVMLSVALPLRRGDLVTNLTFVSGATDVDTPVAWWFALYSSASTPALLSQTADQATTDWPENTVMTLPLATAQRITTTGVYYAAVMVQATTDVPSLIGKSTGVAVASGAILGSPVLARTSGSGLTTTAPATITSATTVASVPLVIAT